MRLSGPAPHSKIRSVGHYLPERVVTNEELAPLIGSTPEWIEERIGIQSRHWVLPGQSNAELGEHAARRALDSAGLGVQDIDAIIYATLSPEAGFPGSGVFLQARLGIPGIPALDVRNQCSGFLYGLSIADAWIRAGVYQRVLLVGSEVHSTGLELAERGQAVTAMFGDGAGAVILEGSDEPGVLDVKLGADGRGVESLWSELPSSTLSPIFDASYLRDGRQYPQMKGRSVFRKAVETLSKMLSDMLSENDIELSSVIYVPHQSNLHICNMVAQMLGIADQHVVKTIQTHGNMTAASIPAALSVALEQGIVKTGDTVLMGAFGSGYTWGGSLIRMT